MVANTIAAAISHFSKLFQVRFAAGIIVATLCDVAKYINHRPHHTSFAIAIDGINAEVPDPRISPRMIITMPYIADVARYVFANETALESLLLNATMVAMAIARGMTEYAIGKRINNLIVVSYGRCIVSMDKFPNRENVAMTPKMAPAPTTTYRKNASQPETLSSVLMWGSKSCSEEFLIALATSFASELSIAA